MSKRVSVRVAATSANLGGGFDCLGIALGLYHTVTAEFSDTLCISGDTDVPHGADNLVYRAMNAVFSKFGKANAAVALKSSSDIPRASGLGSSAACVVAGAVAANALLGDPLDTGALIKICTELDGHPDNVLPALVGGVTAAYREGDGIGYIRADAPTEMTFAVVTPNFQLKTEYARSVLPDRYTRDDCVYSLSRAVVTFGALALQKPEMLKAVGDKLHQPYRIPLVKDYAEIENALIFAGAINCCLSGAGPSVLGFFANAPTAPVALPIGAKLRLLKAENSPVCVSVE